ncbi:MAG: EamA family transporter [Herpetosiphonaceae bacterium]|nr:EamA family transporter [Herpetosiphonaceae bacterium]
MRRGIAVRRGVLFTLGATAFWSTTGLFIDPLVSAYALTPVQVSFWRALLVAPALGLFIAWRQPDAFRLSRREIPYYMVYGLVGIAIFNVVWSASVQINKAAVATALIYSSPVFVTLGARAFFREQLRLIQCLAIGVNVVGCALVAGVTTPGALLHNPAGLGLGLASGVAFAAYTLFGKGATRMGSRSALSILFYIFTISALGLLGWGLLTEGLALVQPHLDKWGWCLLLGLSFGPTLGGYACFTASLRTLPAGTVSLLTTLEPPITAVLAFLLLGRAMTVVQWLGTALIMAGVILIQAGGVQARWASQSTVITAAATDL